MIRQPVYLITEHEAHSDDPLDHTKVSEFKLYPDAYVNDMGASKQFAIFGKIYNSAKVVRLLGEWDAKYLGFSDYDTSKPKNNRYPITMRRVHRGRTDFYVVISKDGAVNVG